MKLWKDQRWSRDAEKTDKNDFCENFLFAFSLGSPETAKTGKNEDDNFLKNKDREKWKLMKFYGAARNFFQ